MFNKEVTTIGKNKGKIAFFIKRETLRFTIFFPKNKRSKNTINDKTSEAIKILEGG